MTEKFFRKIIREDIVDTKKYRYTTREKVVDGRQILQVIRIPLEKLNTTSAFDDWEVVEERG